MSLDLATIGLTLLGLIGHVLLWIEFVNHVHATRMPRWGVWWLTLLGYGFLAGAPTAAAATWLFGPLDAFPAVLTMLAPAVRFYVLFCAAVAVVLAPLAVAHRWRTPLKNTTVTAVERRDLGKELGLRITGGTLSRLLSKVPGNQALFLEVTRKTLVIPNLPAELDGLTICHLTDLHYTGRVPRAYFEEVVRQANALSPDLTLITGDLVDKAHCLDWLAPTLGQLRARHGCYYILGNHDKRVPIDRLREILANRGLSGLSGRSMLLDVRGASILMAGNELPWLPPAADMAQAPLRPGERPHLRLLLSHSPDQYAWARAYRFDLMLAGHNHGGQIVLPLIGPVAVPSRHGVKYAGGLYFEPPTLLHVSRGVSAELPLRLRCPPELAFLELRGGANAAIAPARAVEGVIPPRDC